LYERGIISPSPMWAKRKTKKQKTKKQQQKKTQTRQTYGLVLTSPIEINSVPPPISVKNRYGISLSLPPSQRHYSVFLFSASGFFFFADFPAATGSSAVPPTHINTDMPQQARYHFLPFLLEQCNARSDHPTLICLSPPPSPPPFFSLPLDRRLVLFEAMKDYYRKPHPFLPDCLFFLRISHYKLNL